MSRGAGNKDLKTESIDAARQLNRAAGRCKKHIGSSIENGKSLARAECLIRQFVIICPACGGDAGVETGVLVNKIGEMLPRRRKS